MATDDALADLPPPTDPDEGVSTRTMRERVKEAVDARDAETLTALLDPLPLSAALRQLLALSAEDRNSVLELVPTELAAALVEEAPHAAATEMVERLETERAVEILEELDSDLQGDLIGDLDTADAEAILGEMEPGDAADVRRLAEYDDDTAGGLMQAESFQFPDTATVGVVLRDFVREDQDYERYRGQHPYVVDAEGRPVGVVSLRELLTAKRSEKLTAIMAPVMTVPVSMPLDALQDMFDEYPFLGLPVIEHDGRLVGVVGRDSVHDAALERAESESLRRQGVVGD